MNHFFGIFFLYIFFIGNTPAQSDQQEIFQSIFEIERFQKYFSDLPRFVGSNNEQAVLMLEFPELNNRKLSLEIWNRSIKIISLEEVKEFDYRFYIEISEFVKKGEKATVVLSYSNAKMYYEKREKVLLEAELQKSEEDKWIVKKYDLSEVSINTFD